MKITPLVQALQEYFYEGESKNRVEWSLAHVEF
jgi:hypothetical protein